MLKHFVTLQWKSFFRSASLSSNLFFKIITIFFALYMIVMFTVLGGGIYYILEEKIQQDPFQIINHFLIYYFFVDLVFKYMMQKMPVVNIKPLLYLPFSKAKIVHFSLWKTVLSFFNFIHYFFFIPFAVVLIIEGYPPLQVILWTVSALTIIYCNNFINVFLNDIDTVFYSFLGLLVLLFGLQYYQIFDVTIYTAPVFNALYSTPYLTVIPVLFMVAMYVAAFRYFKNILYLDGGLKQKQQEAKTESFDWLNRFGSIAIFLKNDLKLIKRNKRSRTAVIMSVAFIFYGLLFFSGAVEAYEGPVWRIFAGLFVSGGFLFTFGQYVPSWDSSYYQLMMSQNIMYRDYLNAKWWLIVIATIITTVLASFYVYFGLEVYLAILVAAIYNIGVNSHMVLWGGAYVKTPIDLTSNKKAFGDKQAFNLKTILLTIPKMLLPMALYAAGHYTVGPMLGYLLVAIAGLLGFAFKEKVFDIIEKIYKTEKYKTIAAYKQKN
ncbi:DUF5687 family protein [Zhouia spongiae]|uniref:DUF5687 family protein n=1 Tax=Zhouia spongiae TaxID=2202721 RepID=A0ABY3YSB2_9FLAO|nr:DUF5687 family protein [Zhouia spongiae]UNY99693.1 DUF5687 family protein [Zhouia spongiae]